MLKKGEAFAARICQILAVTLKFNCGQVYSCLPQAFIEFLSQSLSSAYSNFSMSVGWVCLCTMQSVRGNQKRGHRGPGTDCQVPTAVPEILLGHNLRCPESCTCD